MPKMTEEQRAKIDHFLLTEFGPEAVTECSEEGKQEWHDYFTTMNEELLRRASARRVKE